MGSLWRSTVARPLLSLPFVPMCRQRCDGAWNGKPRCERDCPCGALIQTCQTQKWVGCVRGGLECEAGPSFFYARNLTGRETGSTVDLFRGIEKFSAGRRGRFARWCRGRRLLEPLGGGSSGIWQRSAFHSAVDRRGCSGRSRRSGCRSRGANRSSPVPAVGPCWQPGRLAPPG